MVSLVGDDVGLFVGTFEGVFDGVVVVTLACSVGDDVTNGVLGECVTLDEVGEPVMLAGKLGADVTKPVGE